MATSKKKKTNDALGKMFERKLRGAVNKNNDIAENISQSVYGMPGKFKAVYVVGSNNEKNDLIIEYDYSKIIGINLKSGSEDLNQVVRLWPENLNEHCGISENAIKIIRRWLLIAAVKKGFITDVKDQAIISSEFKRKMHKVLQYIFTRDNSSVNVLGITDLTKRSQKYYLFKMNEVINYLSSREIKYSSAGLMYIGKYLIMKRKSGDGNSSKPKLLSDGSPNPTHPGNQLQFHMKILSFVNDSKTDKSMPQAFLVI